LYTDVRRLVALTFPTIEYTERERQVCEYFIDALAEPDCVLRVRQQNPKTLDAALRAPKISRYGFSNQRTFGMKIEDLKKSTTGE